MNITSGVMNIIKLDDINSCTLLLLFNKVCGSVALIVQYVVPTNL